MAKQLAEKILEHLNQHDYANSLDLADILKEDHQKIIGAIKSLQAVGDLIVAKPVSRKKWEVTAEGQHVIDHGSHEAAVFNAIPDDGIPQSEIMKTVPFAKVGFSKALVADWIELDKRGGTPIVRKKARSITDSTRIDLSNLENVPDSLKADYKKRKLLQEVIVKSMELEKGAHFSTKMDKLEAELTAELLANGAWRSKKFKPYNFAALGSTLEIGHLHPLLKVRTEFRKIFLEMGFTEMPTNNYVESSFWNFDALFQPQQHPARDAHDTFFLSDPCYGSDFPTAYLEKVKNVHAEGGYGSRGYRYDWKIEEARKNLLRTHTTAVSARMLYKLMRQGNFRPVKYFSIDRVFRNETLDATHLAEFHQVEGVVADYNLTLGDLIGTLHEFFKKLGITQLQFKPAYNPYTEPSMEIFCYHDGLEKWIEIGNSGMFRPEMLLPMGLPNNVNVIAWGLSLERPTMIKYGLNNIRDLVGPKVDMDMVYNNPICRLDKSSHRAVSQKKKLDDRKEERNEPVPRDGKNSGTNVVYRDKNAEKRSKERLTILCDPKYPIYFLEDFLRIVRPSIGVYVATHIHSSVKNIKPDLLHFCSEYGNADRDVEISLTIIWKDAVGIDPIVRLPGMREIIGQVNIARYMNRLIETHRPNVLRYESYGALHANRIDAYLDEIHGVLHGLDDGSEKMHKKPPQIADSDISIVDIILRSIEDHRTVEN